MGKMISVVIAIREYPLDTLERTVLTLSNQSCPPLEIIIVDGSMDESQKYDDERINLELKYPLLYILPVPMNRFNASKLLNIGIQHSIGDYIMVTGADRLFGNNFIEEVSKLVGESFMVQSGWGVLPKSTDLSGDILSRWDELCKQVIPGSSKKLNPGCAIIIHRDWWFKVRGCDENYPFLYADSSIHIRAKRSGLGQRTIKFSVANVLHRAHPVVSFRMWTGGATLERLYGESVLSPMRNPDGWGEEE